MMYARKNFALLLASLMSVALLWGCGSSGSGGSDVAAGTGTDLAANVQTLGIENCSKCHSSATPVAADWLQSKHASAGDHTSANCAPCHDPLGDSANFASAFGANAVPGREVGAGVVSCEACHGGGSAHRGIGPLPFPVPGPERCGQCHGLQEAIGGPEGRHFDRLTRLIHDTHFDNPETPEIEGYVVDAQNERGCLKCHFNPHNPTLEINKAWAESGHAGHIATVKADAEAAAIAAAATRPEQAAATIAAAVTDAEGPAWSHYDFKGADRAACQRCHTATGAANFLDDPAGYTPTQNVFAATGQQKEMLYCSGCHTGSTSELRDPGALTINFTGASASFPDAGPSNVCIACHSGRESGDSIKVKAGDINNMSFVNSHYLAAGGTLFAKIGYHYEGRTYDQPVNLHSTIGSNGSGPCVTCHMVDADPATPANHTFEAVTKDAAGLVIAINNASLCTGCHVGGSLALDATIVNDLEEGFHAALAALEVQLQDKGIFFANSHPYFFKDPNGDGFTADEAISANAYKTWGNKETMGAAFNFNLLEHEPGAFAHNVRYVQRLIWDSFDWVDNGVLDNSTVAAIDALGLDLATRNAAVGYIGTVRP